MTYDIFLPTFMRFVMCPPKPLKADTLIIQRARMGFVEIESAVQVVDVWDRLTGGTREAGFRYVTLKGHPERGAASFAVSLEPSGSVRVIFEARSLPGSTATRLARPIARWIQLSATRAALKRLTDDCTRLATG